HDGEDEVRRRRRFIRAAGRARHIWQSRAVRRIAGVGRHIDATRRPGGLAAGARSLGQSQLAAARRISATSGVVSPLPQPPPRATGRGRQKNPRNLWDRESVGKGATMLRSNLSLWAYTAPTAAYPLVLSDYGERIEALEFSTVAPGSFGDLACV